ncbi:MAG: transcriptional repressor [Gemmiger sp.]|uniref:Fur family transcriptional regulator n=1 Tax=Gemmiger sp. TaxID=2049027 RepID=UPI002E782364|nr:transcriptional repressor [Gemmiger sp.]MEE0801189.1 transcriptional repressor [Gemmiger sp.]
MTRQRALILNIMRENPGHLTADEIYALAREQMPGIARGTVYRNLKLMEQDREIAKLEMPEGPDRFDKTSAPHGHLYCDGCGSLQDIPVIGLVRDIEAVIGTEVRSYQLTIHYLCPACRSKLSQ